MLSPHGQLSNNHSNELFTPVLEDGNPTEAGRSSKRRPRTSALYKHLLCGLPLGFISPVVARVVCQWLIQCMSIAPFVDSSVMHIFLYVMAGVVVLANVLYVHGIVNDDAVSTKDVDATVGTMLGFCVSWLLLSLFWYGVLDILSVLLIAMHARAYRTVQKRQQKNRHADQEIDSNV